MRRLLAFLTLAMLSSASGAQGVPKEVTQLVNAVTAIPGVSAAQLEKTYLPNVKVSDLSLPGPYADLPIAALRRSKGALPDELLISINFDQSRSGENMQLRALGLPPIVGNNKQLGNTLQFTIDWFYSDPSQDLSKVLAAIAEKARSLETATGIYKSAF